MIRNRAALRVLVVGSVVVASACRDDSTATDPSAPPDAPAMQLTMQLTPQSPSLDPLVGYARAIPGFGGIFLDSNGLPTVYLTDVRQRPAAEAALAEVARGLGASPSQLRVLKADYDYLQLSSWSNQVASQALAIRGTVFVDVDEASNRLRIGVDRSAAVVAVRDVLTRFSVPSAAAVIETTEPVHFAATLQNKVSPLRGGLQIDNSNGGTCTLGFNTWPKGIITYKYFITNSHCTRVRGWLDGTQFFQPGSSNAIGTEVADPPYFTNLPCPSGRVCRFSDAARIKYVTGPGIDHGGIARTTGIGSITIDPANPVFNITAEQATPIQYSILHKIGRTTGWTKGLVIATCVWINVTDSNGFDTGITYICQDRVKAPSGPGDSGSPVFSWSGSGSNVTLNGILWGGSASGTIFNFSRMSQIEGELGSMTTF